MKKSKIISLALAGTLTATALLAGTYAWTSISQRATNETVGDVNPGGRLHDDFNGTNKDIYVENFTSNEEGSEGAVIYARIKLEEYLQIGERIIDPDTTDKEAPSYTDPSTWTIFKLKEKDSSIFRQHFDWTWGGGTEYMPTFNKNKDSLEADINGTLEGSNGVAYDDYVEYAENGVVAGSEDDVDGAKIGSKTSLEIYDMDTDEKNEDEVDKASNLYLNEALIEALDNGSGGIGANFNDTAQTVIEVGKSITLPFTYEVIDVDGTVKEVTDTIEVTVTDVDTSGEDSDKVITAVYLDLDDNSVETPDNEKDGADIKVVAGAEHVAKPTLETKGVINMTEWIAMGCPEGPYWVYDTDGWAYWAQGIAPGTATGCFLTGIDRKGSIVDKYHYAINVTAEFATAGDWGKEAEGNEPATGFQINGITDNGLLLLNTIAGGEKTLFINTPATYEEETGVKPGETLVLDASVTLGEQVISGDEVKWIIENTTDSEIETTGTATALLRVGENEQSPYITVRAALKDAEDKVFNSREIKVGSVYTVTVDETAYLAAENVKEVRLKATVKDQRGDDNYDGVTWALVSTHDEGTVTLTDEGVLTISDAVGATSIQVKATANVDEKTDGEGTITVKSQLEHIASIDMKTPIEKRTAIVDGVEWYVLRKDDVSGDGADDALLWAKKPVEGWLTGGQATDGSLVGWSYYNTSNKVPFKSTEPVASGGQNWWRYSNLRTWLNSTGEDTGNVMEFDENDKPYWSNETTTYYGFLNGKTILANNAVPTVIRTRKEHNTTSAEANFDVVGGTEEYEGDKVFIFTQADIYGTAAGYETDADGNAVTDESGNQIHSNSGTPGAWDYTVDSDLPKELESIRRTSGQWQYLRSPRNNNHGLSSVGISGSNNSADYAHTSGDVRPALWLNLSSSAQQ